MEDKQALVVETKVENGGKKEIIPLEFQDEIIKLVPSAGTITLTQKQEVILYEPVDEKDVEIRPDGLVYLPWMEYVSRLRKAFGMSWAIIPQGMPKYMKENEMIYWGFYLVIQGSFSGFAIGEQKYQPSNATMSYGDAVEGCKSNALMRLCKGLGISLELWKPSFVREWKEKYAESYPGVYPDGKQMKDRFGRPKMLWKKKDAEIQVEEVGDGSPLPNGNGQEEPPSPDIESVHKVSESTFVSLHDRMTQIKTKFELKNWWEKHQAEIKSMLPEHLSQLEAYKNSLKEKFSAT